MEETLKTFPHPLQLSQFKAVHDCILICVYESLSNTTYILITFGNCLLFIVATKKKAKHKIHNHKMFFDGKADSIVLFRRYSKRVYETLSNGSDISVREGGLWAYPCHRMSFSALYVLLCLFVFHGGNYARLRLSDDVTLCSFTIICRDENSTTTRPFKYHVYLHDCL